jgi:hypothetical protein
MDIPKISTDPHVTFDEAVFEYIELDRIEKQEDGFPNNGTGWSINYLHQIWNRKTYLKDIIVTHVLESEAEKNGS